MQTRHTLSPTPTRLRELVRGIPLLNELVGIKPDPLAPRCVSCNRHLRNTVVTFHGRRYIVKACRRCIKRTRERYQHAQAGKEEGR